ncbi:MAG: Type 1 glutamine amidotransferase-like domain-containing protein [Micromonosporaceae bacterium]
MRLYLSSFRMGDHPEHLTALVGGDGRRGVVIANAMDDAPPDVRRAGVELELAALADLGLDAVELDLRGYFAQGQRLRHDLAGVSLAWLRGGNVFMLRYALYRSGADTAFRELLAADALVYAGYSAGPCVLSPSLRGLELVDDAGAVTRIYGSQPVWDGLALLDAAFVPHYRSPGHPETAAIELVVARYRAEGVAYRTLRDGQALVVDGPDTVIV